MQHRSLPVPASIFKRLLYCLVPVFLTALTFSTILGDSFTNWDDDVYVTENRLVKSLSFQNVAAIFSPSTFVSGSYQPVTMLSLAVNYAFSKLCPFGYLLTNLLLHLLNVILVFLLMKRLSRNDLVASLCALLFGLHPMHVESVAWISGRKDLLCGFYYLSGLVAYLRYLEKNGPARIGAYCISLFLLVAALFAKSAAVTAPLVLFLLDFHAGRRFSARVVLEKLPFLLSAAVLGLLAIKGQQVAAALDSGAGMPFMNRIFMGGYSYMFYIVKFIAPVKLSAYYPYPASFRVLLPWPYIISPIFFIMTAAVAWYGRHSKVILFGTGFFLVNTVFILHFVPVGSTITADRFSYLSYIGLFYPVASYAARSFNATRSGTGRKAWIVVAIGATGTLCCLSFNRSGVWKNSVSLWSDVVRNHGNAIACSNLGNAWFSAGRYDEAFRCFDTAIGRDSRSAQAYLLRGTARVRYGIDRCDTGMLMSGIGDLRLVSALRPAEIGQYGILGDAYRVLGQYDSSLLYFNRAIAARQDQPEAYCNRGLVFKALHRYGEAEADFRRALGLQPGLESALIDLGNVYFIERKYQLAIGTYSEAMARNGEDGMLLYNRGVAWLSQGDSQAAMADLNRACSIGFQPACNRLQKMSATR